MQYDSNMFPYNQTNIGAMPQGMLDVWSWKHKKINGENSRGYNSNRKLSRTCVEKY